MSQIQSLLSKVILVLLVSSFTTAAYAANDLEDDEYNYKLQDNSTEIYDPYEKLNRKVFVFNSILDHFLLRPVAVGYQRVTNKYTKERVSSFIDNVGMPLTVVNYGFQGKFNNGMKSFWRFLINSTLGIGGLFDVATKMGVTVQPQSFGNTLAHYGVGPGPYLVIPFLGSANARDAGDIVILNRVFNPLLSSTHKDFQLVFTGVKMVNGRAELLPVSDFIAKNSPDPYAAVRSAVHQNRESKVEYPEGFKYPEVPVGGK